MFAVVKNCLPQGTALTQECPKPIHIFQRSYSQDSEHKAEPESENKNENNRDRGTSVIATIAVVVVVTLWPTIFNAILTTVVVLVASIAGLVSGKGSPLACENKNAEDADKGEGDRRRKMSGEELYGCDSERP